MIGEAEQRTLRQRAESLARIPESELDERILELVVLPVGDECYGVDPTAVGTVDLAAVPTPVPESPGAWEGLTSLHGDIYPVLDLNRHLGVGHRSWRPAAAVVLRGPVPFAALCSELPYLIRVPGDQVRPSLHNEGPAIGLVTTATKRLVTWLDVHKLVDFDNNSGGPK